MANCWLENEKVESIWVSEHLGRQVVKAFNNLLAHTLAHAGKAAGAEGSIAMAVSGEDENAKKIVSGMINDAGFDAVDAGSLSEFWRHQPGAPAFCTELNVAELKQALTDGVKEYAVRLSDLAITKLMDRTTPSSHEEVVTLNHSFFLKSSKIK